MWADEKNIIRKNKLTVFLFGKRYLGDFFPDNAMQLCE